jgi:hypothetical protein
MSHVVTCSTGHVLIIRWLLELCKCDSPWVDHVLCAWPWAPSPRMSIVRSMCCVKHCRKSGSVGAHTGEPERFRLECATARQAAIMYKAVRRLTNSSVRVPPAGPGDEAEFHKDRRLST